MTVFTEVVAAGSFVGAGQRLGLTPSGVSRKISRFEERLEVRLFNRTTRKLSLTEAGETLFESCGGILSSIRDAEDAARDLAGTPTGTLRIAASDALQMEVLLPFLNGFIDAHPKLAVTLVQGDGAIDMLDERVDVALMFEDPKETSFIVKKMIDDPWVVCVSPEYTERYGVPVEPGDLLDHQCITIHARGRTSDRWDFVSDGDVETIHINSVFSGIGLTAKAAVLSGFGIARLAHFLVCKDIENGTLIELFAGRMPESTRALYAVYPNRKHLAMKTKVFVDELSTYIRKTLRSPES